MSLLKTGENQPANMSSSIVRNEWGAWATHWWAWQFSCFSLIL